MYVAFIEKTRREKRITQAEMAEVIGVSRRQYQRLECGGTAISLSQLEKIMERLGLKVQLVVREVVL